MKPPSTNAIGTWRSGPWRAHRLSLAIGIAVLARVVAFLATIRWPIPNEAGRPISPLHQPAYVDFGFYIASLRRYSESLIGVLGDFVRFYEALFQGPPKLIIAGPIYPALVSLTGAADGSFLPLAILSLVLSSILAAVWLWWLHSRGLGIAWLVTFAVLPNPIWHMLITSVDLIFAVEFMLFWFAYTSSRASRLRSVLWITALVLMILTRPNSLSILMFVLADQGLAAWRTRQIRVLPLLGLLVITVISGFYLYPYFLFEIGKAGSVLQYFGRVPAEYAAGIFDGLPRYIDIAVSMLCLLAAKLLYLVGLRPSYGDVSWTIVLLRGAAGIILLPGIVRALFWAPIRERLVVFLYCAPFIAGPSQDRYYLSALPFLFLYGAEAWSIASQRVLALVRGRPGPRLEGTAAPFGGSRKP